MSNVLSRVIEDAPQIPRFMKQTVAAEEFSQLAEEAKLILETHRLKTSIERARYDIAKASICGDLKYLIDEQEVNDQVKTMIGLQRDMSNLKNKLPELKDRIEVSHRPQPGSTLVVNEKHRSSLIQIVHDMVRIVARGPHVVTDSLQSLENKSIDTNPSAPSDLTKSLQRSSNILTSDLTTLMTALDKLDSAPLM